MKIAKDPITGAPSPSAEYVLAMYKEHRKTCQPSWFPQAILCSICAGWRIK
jgi:hypothetical protein